MIIQTFITANCLDIFVTATLIKSQWVVSGTCLDTCATRNMKVVLRGVSNHWEGKARRPLWPSSSRPKRPRMIEWEYWGCPYLYTWTFLKLQVKKGHVYSKVNELGWSKYHVISHWWRVGCVNYHLIMHWKAICGLESRLPW